MSCGIKAPKLAAGGLISAALASCWAPSLARSRPMAGGSTIFSLAAQRLHLILSAAGAGDRRRAQPERRIDGDPDSGTTGWGVFRLVRAEYMKHKVREYVLAADVIGASDARRMFVHIFPNVSHVVLVQLSLHVVLFIKSEVILSFLGFGVGVETVSWGSMLNEAQNELIIGKWWQLGAATAAMALLVTAFSLFTDALRDALDPRLK
jgi:hypothetical protein